MSECDPTCEAKGIPRHLHQLDRPVDSNFDAKELLYRRFPTDCEDLTAAISFERMSVNRGKYCLSPDDALWNDKEGGRYSGVKVMAFTVQALLLLEKHPQENYQFSLRPEHKPESCNYSHSEVVATKVLPDGAEESLEEIRPKSVKLALRQALRDAISIVPLKSHE
jgi:hypothetical protein